MDYRISDLTCEFETKSEGEDGSFTGIASTSDTDLHNDVISPGAFDPIPVNFKTGGPDVLMLRDHDPHQVIGGWKSFKQQGRRLFVEGQLCLEVEKARETYALLRRGFLSGISVGFNIPQDGMSYNKGRRFIHKANLKECSIVGRPANSNARVLDVKSEFVFEWLQQRGLKDEDIKILCEGGLEALFEARKNSDEYDPPEIKPNESRTDYMGRCMRKLTAQGADRKEAMSECSAYWDDEGKEEAPSKPYGDVAYADPGYQEDKKKRYPIDTEGHIRAAWNYIHKPKNRAFYSKDQLDKIEGRIIAAWKRKIDKDGPPAAEDAEDPPDNTKKLNLPFLGIDGYLPLTQADTTVLTELNTLLSKVKGLGYGH